MKFKLFSKLIFISFIILYLSGCKSDNEDSAVIVNREIYNLMTEIYLWYEHLPEANPEGYSDPNEFIKSLRYTTYDKWSFVMPKDVYYQYFEEGEMIGHGFVISHDADENVRIAMIYPSTQAYSLGVRRGWIIRKVNGTFATPENISDIIGPGQLGISNRIEFINTTGDLVELTLVKQVIELNPVIFSNVFNHGGKKIGYFVFQDFIDVAEQELNDVFDMFKQQDIDDLIIDLRYNGGGNVDIAVHLAGWLTGNKNSGKKLINFVHNNKQSGRDTAYNIPVNVNSLDLGRIVFIGTEGTASASELIINGMEPYMNVELIGTPTEGKPVGMYVFLFKYYNYAVFPISFKYTNASDIGDFYDGLQPDILVNDDLTKDFGDINEPMLKAALNYIDGGGIATKKNTVTKSKMIKPHNSISDFQRAF